ncbi:MAG: hypothetical protein WCK54_21130 [Desulfuromonadales bacterium]
MAEIISSEKLAYWYFRLNGFLTTENFIVHPEYGQLQKTEVDILGVRFPYRSELLTDPMTDDKLFTDVHDKPCIIFVEVKHSDCKINKTLLEIEKQNIPRLLKAIGAFADDSMNKLHSQYMRKAVSRLTNIISQ